MKFVILVVGLLFSSAISGCTNQKNRQGSHQLNSVIPPEKFIEMNRQLVEAEQAEIAHYVEQNQLNMEVTATGMWYSISEPGTGSRVLAGNVVTLDYKVWLLDGTLIYDSEELGPKVFKVGQGGVESGLEEGILMLRDNGKAIFLMPPHLAHGHLGDDNKIPYRAIIKYEVKVIDVKGN